MASGNDISQPHFTQDTDHLRGYLSELSQRYTSGRRETRPVNNWLLTNTTVPTTESWGQG